MYSTIQSPRKKKEKKKKAKVIAAVVFVCVAFVSYGIVWIFSHPSLQIVDIKVTGTKILKPEGVRGNVERAVLGNYLYFFPKKNIVLYPKDGIKKNILKLFPEVSDVSLNVDALHTLLVTIKEREPAAIWCGKDKPDADVLVNSGCFYVDNSGFIFGTSPRFSGDAYFTLYGSPTESFKKKALIGQYLVSPVVFRKILDLRSFFSENHVTLDNVFFGENGYAEFFDQEKYSVRWNTDQNVEVLESNILAVFRSSLWKNGSFSSSGENATPVEYLDFRFGNKVFYKQKGEDTEILTETSAEEKSVSDENGTSTSDEIPDGVTNSVSTEQG